MKENKKVNEVKSMTIKEARLAAGLTQIEFSEMFGIPLSTVKKWDSGVRKTPEWAERLLIEKLEELLRKK